MDVCILAFSQNIRQNLKDTKDSLIGGIDRVKITNHLTDIMKYNLI